jgi:hypothetical protein
MTALLIGLALGATVSGTVTDAQGSPVDNAFVIVYDSRFQFEFAQTDDTGFYEVTDLPGDRFRVRILPPSASDAAEQWAGGVLGACNAPSQTVGAEEVAVIDVQLFEGARLAGRVLREGEPLQGARVTAKTRRSSIIAQSRFDFTDDNGDYEIRGITPDEEGMGVFVVEVQATDVPTQLYPGVYGNTGGDEFTVLPGSSEDLPDFPLRLGVTVSGTVSGPSGLVNGGEIAAFSGSRTVTAPIAGGGYTARGLRPGEVLVWAYADGLATTYFPSSPTPGDRISLPEDGDSAREVDLALPTESRFTAHMLGGPFTASSVLLFNEAQTSAVSAEVEEDGTVTVGTLHPGRYLMFVDAVDDGFVEGFVLNDVGDPRAFLVDGAADVGDVTLARGGSISGIVNDMYTGEPIYGAAIIAEPTVRGDRRSTTTNRDGEYSLEGLTADRWRLRAEYQSQCLPDPLFVPTYYPDRINPTFGGVVEVVAGGETEWNPTLAPDVDRDGMDDVWEAENGLDPTRDDGLEDADGDGFTNRDEYLLGTDPNETTVMPVGEAGCSCSSPSGSGWGLWLACGALFLRRRRVLTSL